MSSRYVIQPLDLPEALLRIQALINPVATTEGVTLDTALGRILSESLTAEIDVPPFPSSAMDGYALRAGKLKGSPPHNLRCVGESLAGHPYSGTIDTGECIAITTGAAVPDSADCVVAQEDCEVDGEQIEIAVTAVSGDNVRAAGNDFCAGTTLLTEGRMLNAFDLAWLASAGISHIGVRSKPSVAVFSSGDELRAPGERLQPGQIFDSNRYALRELLSNMPVSVTDMGVLADDPERITAALAAAAERHELLLTSGGVSVGSADFLKEALQQLGSLDLWRLNLKPGKPLAFGRLGNCVFIGLPGNPVSAIVTFLLIARPAILTLAGCKQIEDPLTFPALLRCDVKHTPGREEYQRGRLFPGNAGMEVDITGEQSSNRLSSFSNADCLVRISKESADLSAGTQVTVLPFHGLI